MPARRQARWLGLRALVGVLVAVFLVGFFGCDASSDVRDGRPSSLKASSPPVVVDDDPDRVRGRWGEDERGAQQEPRRIHANSPRGLSVLWMAEGRAVAVPACGGGGSPVGLVERASPRPWPSGPACVVWPRGSRDAWPAVGRRERPRSPPCSNESSVGERLRGSAAVTCRSETRVLGRASSAVAMGRADLRERREVIGRAYRSDLFFRHPLLYIASLRVYSG